MFETGGGREAKGGVLKGEGFLGQESLRRPTGVSEGEGPWGPRRGGQGSERRRGRVLTDQGASSWSGERRGPEKGGSAGSWVWGGRCSKREDEDGRTRPYGRPSGRGSIGRKPGCEQQGGRRVLLRADFARAASRPLPLRAATSRLPSHRLPREGARLPRRPLRDARASLPASRPLAPRSSPSRPDPGRRALTSQTDTLA